MVVETDKFFGEKARVFDKDDFGSMSVFSGNGSKSVLLESPERLKISGFPFDKAWANSVLKIGIEECYGRGSKVLSSRLVLIVYCLDFLESEGYIWQLERLRNHFHLALKKGLISLPLRNPKGSDPPLEGGEGGDSP